MNKQINILIGSFFYLGFARFGPGTLASFFASIIWFAIPNLFFLQLLIILLGFLLGNYLIKNYVSYFNNQLDPSSFVIDEVIGVWITLFLCPKNIILYFFGFLLFRYFDIFKPSFIYRSQYCGRYFGVMFDDILAGLISMTFLIHYY